MQPTARPATEAPEIGLVGRVAERALFRHCLRDSEPLILFVHGIGGIGKSALLDAFGVDARSAGAVLIRLDGGSIEPTAGGFLRAISAATGADPGGPDAVAARIGAFGPRVVLEIDRYEVLQAIDPWLRGSFIPALSDTIRVVIAGRDRPSTRWVLELGGLFRSVPLTNLEREDAMTLLRRDGVTGTDLERIHRLARGHPLSLRLAAAALEAGPARDLERATETAIVTELTQLYLDRLQPLTRQVLDAASVVRRPTMSLLAAMVPDGATTDLFGRLLGLPFVELGNDGLVIHDTVRETVAAILRERDPDRSRRHRIAAWHQLRAELARSSPTEMRRYAADLLYIIENPLVREAYFPTTAQPFSVDSARPEDLEAILELSRRQNPDDPPTVVIDWWNRAPWAFRTVRDDAGSVAGFSVLTELEGLPPQLLAADPVARRWSDHLRAHAVPAGMRCLAYRFERADPSDPSASSVHAACFLDLFRATMELRPALRRRYQVSQRIFDAADVETTLGLERIPGPPIEVPGSRPRHIYVLDFGPGSVDAWLTRLIARELQVETSTILDLDRRQLVVDDRRVDLTPLEFGVMSCLHDRPGTIVTRATLLREVWGYEDAGGSNVVEAIVGSLRRKLGPRSAAIKTVRGIGYRFAGLD